MNNTAILSKALIELKDQEYISNLLENKINYVFIMNVDSLGHIVNIEKIRSKEHISEEFKKEIENYLIRKNVQFYICYESPPGLSKDEAMKLITKNLFIEDKKKYLINVAFPGRLLLRYYQEEEKRDAGMDYLSKYKYLKKRTKEFLYPLK